MVPLVVLALMRGPAVGMLAGAFCGSLDIVIEPFIFHPVQVVMDYPVAFALIGLSGILAPLVKRAVDSDKTFPAVMGIALASLIGVFGRFVAATVSGFVFFQDTFPETMNPWVYSIVYNASYLLPSLVFTIIATAVTVPVILRTVGKADHVG
jgi:thiamine transporter